MELPLIRKEELVSFVPNTVPNDRETKLGPSISRHISHELYTSKDRDHTRGDGRQDKTHLVPALFSGSILRSDEESI